MEASRISIIIPCYNSEKLLAGCLDGVLAQEYDNKEIIIVDGYSKDRTTDIINRYSAGHSFIRWISEKDRGIYDAMNKGVGMATGEWVYFLGTDDFFHHTRVLAGIFSTGRAVASDIIYGNAEFKYSKRIYDGPYNLRRLLFESNICHQAIFYRRTVFEQVGLYDIACRIYADRDFNIRCWLHKGIRINYLDTIVAVYNEKDGVSALEGDDPVFRTKQARYIGDYNSNPVRAFVKRLRQIAALVKRSHQAE